MKRLLLFLFLLPLLACSQSGILGFVNESSLVDHPPVNLTGKTVYYHGNSITYGVGASPRTTARYSTRLTGMLGAVEVNYGISNSTLEKRSPVNIIGGVNMLDRLTNIPTKGSSDGLLVISFGMNDWGCNGVNYTPENFTTDYYTVIDYALARGWLASEILILSPTYPTDAAPAFYNSNFGNGLPTRQRMLDFVAACQTVAITKGTRYLNLYADFESNNPAELVGTDGVHPTNAGHSRMATAIYNYLTQ